jgi:preprotein translocase subunit SecA
VAAGTWTVRDGLWQTYLRWAGIPVEYDLRPYLPALERISRMDLARVNDPELRSRATALRDAVRGESGRGQPPDRSPRLDPLLPEVFAVAGEAAARSIGLRPFDVQLAAGVALHEGRVAQLATGEGKTLVAVLPAILNALSGRGVHVFTANDYLARRDAGWMGPVYEWFGLRAAFVSQGMSREERRRAYAADVTYVTAKEAGFDFLRDNTADDPSLLVQRPYNYVIVDEADFILIDEARVPLVIAGPSPSLGIDHPAIARIVADLRHGLDFDADEYQRTAVLTTTGFERAGELLGGVDLRRQKHRLLLAAIHVALHARALLRRDRDYIIRDGRVELVDEFTGRVAENRRWPHGIQSAVEAKEGVEVRPEGQVLGSIPIQHFVRLYPKIAGMTATAVPAAEELGRFFGLTTVVFPPHRARRRVDEDDVIFTHREEKTSALVDEIVRVHATGRPVLVGTASVRESEDLAAILASRGVECPVLNARHDDVEAQIVARAGARGAVTISTNMAGRGTDIVLGAAGAAINPARCDAQTQERPCREIDRGALRQEVADLGGLYVIGTNRHESRRIDDQLRGRAGRQGDPGSSRFFVSLEDDLIERYGVVGLIPKSHRPARKAGAVEDPIVRREVARAQRIIEGQNFEIRKTLWRYSEMVEEQRRQASERRQALLGGEYVSDLCEKEAAGHFRMLVEAVGEAQVRDAERRLMLHLLDRSWADHLALIEDIREGIHLQRLGGREPLTEFQRQIIEAFDEMLGRVEDETVRLFRKLKPEDGRIDLARVGVGGSTTTWTYLVNDNPFSSFGISLLSSRTLASAVGILAVVYWPITVAVSANALVKRFLRRRKRRRGLKNEEALEEEESAQETNDEPRSTDRS